MTDLNISDAEITELEKCLLPIDCKFDEDARKILRCWESKEVGACPGSGKTTVLLGKLKLLADRIPLDNNHGVCVLSHTNVAVNEVKSRLRDDSNRLLSYPNYIGTLQTFIDYFLALPYIQQVLKIDVQINIVDDNAYATSLKRIFLIGDQYKALRNNIHFRVKQSNGGLTFDEGVKSLKLKDDAFYLLGKKNIS